jgi:hypothetical protein
MHSSRLPVHDCSGPSGEAGRVHGAALRDLLAPPFSRRYVADLGRITRTTPDDLVRQAARWLERLPAAFQEEIAGMASGAGVAVSAVAEFLYADIARPTAAATGAAGAAAIETELLRGAAPPAGPMCSAVSVAGDRGPWIGRNCDWLYATLSRGTAAVIHRTPNRIPVMAVGIRGDIDVDTGINAERLWLHLHTMAALDDPPDDRTCISWLFWAREALETCASLDELERFIESTTRDRGVIVVAADGKTGDTAVFECTRGGHRRVDQTGPWLAATNHTLSKRIDEERARSARPGSTVARLCAMRERLERDAPERFPDGLVALLADDAVEMRRPTHLRTIYAAAVRPAAGELWFAAGGADGRPAASTGRWARVPVPF